MIEIVEVQSGNRIVKCYCYTKFAFQTEQGVFTLVGSDKNGIDTFKNIEKGTFHEWERKQVYEWLVSCKIIAVDESNTIDWYIMSKNKNSVLKRLK